MDGHCLIRVHHQVGEAVMVLPHVRWQTLIPRYILTPNPVEIFILAKLDEPLDKRQHAGG